MLKRILVAFGLLLLLPATLIYGLLGSHRMLDFAAQKAISLSGLPLHYERLEGSLLDGLRIEGVDYDGKVHTDLALKVDFGQLRDRILHIASVRVTDLTIDPAYLQSLIENNTTAS